MPYTQRSTFVGRTRTQNAQGDKTTLSKTRANSFEKYLRVQDTVTPLQQGLLGTSVGVVTKLSLVNLETQNESPDQTKDQTAVLVHNVFGTDINETNVLSLHVLEAVVQVLQLLEASLGCLDHLRQLLATENLEQAVQVDTIRHALLQLLNNDIALHQVTVAPSGESLQKRKRQKRVSVGEDSANRKWLKSESNR